MWERPGRCLTAISSRGSAAGEQPLQAGPREVSDDRPTPGFPMRKALVLGAVAASWVAKERWRLPWSPGQKAKQLLRLEHSAEPPGLVTTCPVTNSACSRTLVAQQRADVNALITRDKFSKESELLINTSRQPFGCRGPGRRTLPAPSASRDPPGSEETLPAAFPRHFKSSRSAISLPRLIGSL